MSFPNYFGNLLKNGVFPTKMHSSQRRRCHLLNLNNSPMKWKDLTSGNKNIEVLKDVCNPFLCTYLNEIRANEYSF